MQRPTSLLAATAAVVLALTAAGCGAGSGPAADPAAPAPASTGHEGHQAPPEAETAEAESADAAPAGRLVDPREGGLEIVLGEWAIAAEALVIRPGRVTFVVHNRGAHPHGFELESEDRRDESGRRRDRRDRFKHETRVLAPGESARLTLDLPPGLYKIECLVDGHDDLGMEDLLEVRADAPLVREEPEAEAEANVVRITGFAFEPESITISAGETVTWINDDAAPHTATHEGGAFDSGTLARGNSFSFRFDRPGTFDYLCALHPEMRGTVVVR